MNYKLDLQSVSSVIYNELKNNYINSTYMELLYNRDKSIRDIIITLNYLENSIELESPNLFHDYLIWLLTILKKMGLSEEDYYEMFSIIRKSLKAKFEQIDWDIYIPVEQNFYTIEVVQSTSLISYNNSYHKEADKYLNYLLTTQRIQAHDFIFQLIESGVSLIDIYLNIFQPVQREIGRLWQLNRISVALEHYSTAVTQQIMSELYPIIFKTEKIGKKLLTAAVGTELHELGIRMVSDIFEINGWDTVFLGANTPATSLDRIIGEVNPDVVGISATMLNHVPRIKQMIELIKSQNLDLDFKIMVGGYPFLLDENLWEKVGADFFAVNALDAVKKANEIIN